MRRDGEAGNGGLAEVAAFEAVGSLLAKVQEQLVVVVRTNAELVSGYATQTQRTTELTEAVYRLTGLVQDSATAQGLMGRMAGVERTVKELYELNLRDRVATNEHNIRELLADVAASTKTAQETRTVRAQGIWQANAALIGVGGLLLAELIKWGLASGAVGKGHP